jgi:hypothetical protein
MPNILGSHTPLSFNANSSLRADSISGEIRPSRVFVISGLK